MMTSTRDKYAARVPNILASTKNVCIIPISFFLQYLLKVRKALTKCAHAKDAKLILHTGQGSLHCLSHTESLRTIKCGENRFLSRFSISISSCFSVPALGVSIVSITYAIFIISYCIGAEGFDPLHLNRTGSYRGQIRGRALMTLLN